MAKIKRSRFADSTVITKKEDPLAKVDVYTKAPCSIVNAVGPSTVSAMKAAADNVKKFTESPSLKGLKGIIDSVEKLTKTDIGKMVGDIVGGKVNIDSLGKEIAGNILDSYKVNSDSVLEQMGSLGIGSKQIQEMADKITDNGMKVITAGKEIVKQIEDVKSIKDLNDLAGKITGDKNLIEVIDLKNRFDLTGALVNYSDSIGLPDIADKLIATMNNEDQVKFFKDKIDNFVDSSNIERIKESIEKVGPKVLLAETPKLVENILKNVNKGIDIDVNLDKALEITDLVESINSDWLKTTRNGVEVISTEILANANDTIKKVLNKNPELAELIAIKDQYKITDFKTLTGNCYGNIGI